MQQLLYFSVVLDGCDCDYFMEKIIVLKQRITAGFIESGIFILKRA